MKLTLFVTALLLGFFAQACPQPEAQFIAKVQAVSEAGGVCRVVLSQIISWNENQLCPLDVDSVTGSWITAVSDRKCSIGSGDTVSGLMTLSPAGGISF